MTVREGIKAVGRRLGLARPQAKLERWSKGWMEWLNHRLPADPWLEKARNRHAGERCFLLGNGPSLNLTDLSKLRDEVTFGVNGIFLADLRPTYYTTISATYWRHHIDAIRNIDCDRRFLPTGTQRLASSVPTSWLRAQRPVYETLFGEPLPVPVAFSRQPERLIYLGGTVLFVCMQLAYHLGFQQAVVLGVDHSYGLGKGRSEDKGRDSFLEKTDGTHFSQQYHAKGERFHVDLEAMERAYELAHQAFVEDGREIVNASPGSHLETFPKVDYTSLF